MPNNLHEKVTILLEDIKSLNKYEAADKLERFINEEVQFLHTEHVLGKHDLGVVRSHAIREFQKIDPRILNEHGYDLIDDARAWCYIEAVLLLFRSKGLISFTTKYDRKKR